MNLKKNIRGQIVLFVSRVSGAALTRHWLNHLSLNSARRDESIGVKIITKFPKWSKIHFLRQKFCCVSAEIDELFLFSTLCSLHRNKKMLLLMIITIVLKLGLQNQYSWTYGALKFLGKCDLLDQFMFDMP